MKSIFVSSTFRDMQTERDLLHMVVIPEINEFVRKYGQSISFTDLRWGVNTDSLDSQQGAHKVLSVCLDEIDNCKPYMLVFIGERYGWIPEEQYLKEAAYEKDYTLDEYSKSVTALEIEYGALRNSQSAKRCLFYFRQPLPSNEMTEEQRSVFCAESETCAKRLALLKQKISDMFPDQIRHYKAEWDNGVTGLNNLAELLCEDIKELFIKEWGNAKKRDWQQEALDESRLALEEECRRFGGRGALLRKYKETISDNKTKLFILSGTSGKTAIFSRIAKDFEEAGQNIIFIICGMQRSEEPTDILAQLVYSMETLLKQEHNDYGSDFPKSMYSDFNSWWDAFSRLVYDYGRKETVPLTIFIDGLEKANNSCVWSELKFLPDEIPDGVTIVLSGDIYDKDDLEYGFQSGNGYCLPDILPFEEYAIHEQISNPTLEDAVEIVKGIARANRKELSDVVVKAVAAPDAEIVEDYKDAITNFPGKSDTTVSLDEMINRHAMREPLYYALLAQRLMMMDSDDFAQIDKLGGDMAAINQFMLSIIDNKDTIQGVAMRVMFEACERISPDLKSLFLPMIALSSGGLREEDLEKISQRYELSFSKLDMSRLIKYMRPFFNIKVDGRIYITSARVRQGCIYWMQSPNEYRKQLLEYIVSGELSYTDIVFLANVIPLARRLEYNCYPAWYIYVLTHVAEMPEDKKEFYKVQRQAERAMRENCAAGSWLKECFDTLRDSEECFSMILTFLKYLVRYDKGCNMIRYSTSMNEETKLLTYQGAYSLAEFCLMKCDSEEDRRDLKEVLVYFKKTYADLLCENLDFQQALVIYSDLVTFIWEVIEEDAFNGEKNIDQKNWQFLASLAESYLHCVFAVVSILPCEEAKETEETLLFNTVKFMDSLKRIVKDDSVPLIDIQLCQALIGHELSNYSRKSKSKLCKLSARTIDMANEQFNKNQGLKTAKMLLNTYAIACRSYSTVKDFKSCEKYLLRAEKLLTWFMGNWPGEDYYRIQCELNREKAQYYAAQKNVDKALEFSMSCVRILTKKSNARDSRSTNWRLIDALLFTGDMAESFIQMEQAKDCYMQAREVCQNLVKTCTTYDVIDKYIECGNKIVRLLEKNDKQEAINVNKEDIDVLKEQLDTLKKCNQDENEGIISYIESILKDLHDYDTNKM